MLQMAPDGSAPCRDVLKDSRNPRIAAGPDEGTRAARAQEDNPGSVACVRSQTLPAARPDAPARPAVRTAHLGPAPGTGAAPTDLDFRICAGRAAVVRDIFEAQGGNRMVGLLLAACSLAGIAQPAAVVLEVQGPATVEQAGKRTPARRRSALPAGSHVLVPEDAQVVLLYASGRRSRVRGPARVEIRPATKPANPTLAAVFRGLVRPSTTSTVGGVRSGAPRVLSPASHGVTPRTFRLALAKPSSTGRSLGGAALADEVRIVALRGRRTLFQVALPPAQTIGFVRAVQLDPQIAADTPLQLEMRFVAQGDDDLATPEVLDVQRSRFQLATAAEERQLAADLKAIDALATQEGLSERTRRTLRIGCFRGRRFLGEAAVEELELRLLKTRPQPPAQAGTR